MTSDVSKSRSPATDFTTSLYGGSEVLSPRTEEGEPQSLLATKVFPPSNQFIAEEPVPVDLIRTRKTPKGLLWDDMVILHHGGAPHEVGLHVSRVGLIVVGDDSRRAFEKSMNCPRQ